MKRSYFFVRHGRAVYQEAGFDRSEHPPGADLPLGESGRAQVRAFAPKILRFGITRVVSSQLARARQTGRAIADEGGLPFGHHWGGLDEIHPTTLRAGLRRTDPVKWSWWDGYRAARAVRAYVEEGVMPSGWELRSVEARVARVLARLDALVEPRVVVCGHGYWILLAALFVGGRVRYRWIDNCSVTRIDADGEGRYRMVSFASVL